MLFLYLLMLFPVVIIFIVTFRRLVIVDCLVTPIMGWVVGLAYFILLPLILLIVNGGFVIPESHQVLGYWGEVDLSRTVYLYSVAVTCASLALAFLSVYFLTKMQKRRFLLANLLQIKYSKLNRILWICSTLMVLEWVYNVASTGGIHNYFQEHWYSRHEASIKNYAEAYVFLLYVSVVNQVVFTAATGILIVGRINRRHNKNIALTIGLTLMVLNMIYTGNRIFIALLILYVVASLIVYRRWHYLLLIALMAPVAIGLLSMWAYVRGDLTNIASAVETYQEHTVVENNVVMRMLVETTEGTNVMLLLHIINDYGTKYEFLNGSTYSKALTFMVPRSLYPDKPESFSVIAAKTYEPDAATSLSSTAMGEMYANFGLFMIVLLPIMTIVIVFISHRVTDKLHKNYILSSIMFFMFAWMARSEFASNFIFILFAMIFIRGLSLEKGLFYSASSRKLLRPTI